MEEITFTQQLSFQALVRFAWYRYFSRPVIWVVYGVGLFNLGNMLWAWATDGREAVPMEALIIMISIIFLLPFIVFLNQRTIFQTSTMLQKEHLFQISSQGVQVSGEAFALRYDWEAIHQVKEYRNWLLIFPNRYHTLYLHKQALEPGDWELARAIIKRVPDLDANFRA